MDKFKVDLELCLDHYGTADILHTLADIAYEKAQHVSSTYNDIGLTQDWEKVAEQYITLASKIILIP